MGQWESDLDRHITGNYGEDQFDEGVCPKCGKSSEDVEELEVSGLTRTTIWKCSCGAYIADEGFIPLHEWVANNKP